MQSKTFIVYPEHLNKSGALQGGQLELWLDQFAEKYFIAVTGQKCLTKVFKEMVLNKPVLQSDVVHFTANVVGVTEHSLEIEVEIYVNGTVTGSKRFVNVAVDDNLKKTSVQCETDLCNSLRSKES